MHVQYYSKIILRKNSQISPFLSYTNPVPVVAENPLSQSFDLADPVGHCFSGFVRNLMYLFELLYFCEDVGPVAFPVLPVLGIDWLTDG